VLILCLLTQGSTVVSMAAVVDSVTVLSLSGVKLYLHTVINLLKCFLQLENLYIKVMTPFAMTKVCIFTIYIDDCFKAS
jgi:hypothetical protein